MNMRKIITLLALCCSVCLTHAQGKITLTTQKGLNSGNWSIELKANEADKASVWIDWNNNGSKDDGESEIDFHYGTSAEITSQTVTVYGNITSLKVPDMSLTAVDIVTAPQLENLDLRTNKLSAVDLSSCNKLQKLILSYNPINGITWPKENHISDLTLAGGTGFLSTVWDLSSFKDLEELKCNGNNITKLTLPTNNKLTILACYDNKLTEIDVSHNTHLDSLICDQNRLTTIDLSNNRVL